MILPHRSEKHNSQPTNKTLQHFTDSPTTKGAIPPHLLSGDEPIRPKRTRWDWLETIVFRLAWLRWAEFVLLVATCVFCSIGRPVTGLVLIIAAVFVQLVVMERKQNESVYE